MKCFLLSTGIYFFLAGTVFAQHNEGDILGTWLTETGEGIVQIYKSEGKFYGKLVWLQNPFDNKGNPSLDIKNRDKSLRNRKLMGLMILDSFIYDHENRDWENGKVYDPNMGHEASGILTLISKDVLKVKGYVGFKWISKSEIWKKTSRTTQ